MRVELTSHPISNGMNSNIAFGIGFLVLVVLLGAYFLIPGKPSDTGTPTVTSRPLKTYYDERYKIAFNFPDNYVVTAHDPSANHHVIVLMEQAAASSTPTDSEGPPSMTMDIFSKPSTLQVDKWIKNTKESNYNLGQDSTLSTTTVAGEKALAYGWDGLYRSTSIVFSHLGRIYMVSVGYNAPTDQIFKDFAGVVASVQLDP